MQWIAILTCIQTDLLSDWKTPQKMITSKGNEIEVTLNDKDGSKMCNFKSCNYTCVPDLREDPTINTNTFSFKSVPNNVRVIIDKIQKLYLSHVVLTESNILKMTKTPVKHQDLLLYVLNIMVSKKFPINDRGVLRRTGNKYRFVPFYLKSEYSTLNNSRRKTKKKTDLLKLNKFKFNIINNEPEEQVDISDILKSVDKYNTQFVNNLDNNVKKGKINQNDAQDMLASEIYYLTEYSIYHNKIKKYF